MTTNTLIRGGRVVDGTGNPWFYADVVISGDRIADVAPPGTIAWHESGEVIEAANHVVCPGFIDILSHSIIPLMLDPRCLSKITQGVTTEIMGEGWTPAPFGGRVSEPLSPRHMADPRLQRWVERIREWRRFGDWLSAYEEEGVSPNIGAFLGGGRLWEYVKGIELGPATTEELASMRSIAREAMEDGAFGVSFALIYPPDAFISTKELVDICAVVGGRGGIYATHVRSETDRLEEAVEEAIEIGRQAAIPVEIYHLKAFGGPNWRSMGPVIERIDRARSDGIDVTVDVYPYTACGTGLTAVLPPWASAGGKLFDNLHDKAMRARIRAEALDPSGDWEAMGRHAGPESIMPVLFQRPENREYAGKCMAEIAASRNQEWIDAAMDLLIEEGQRIETVYFGMSEDNLRAELKKPWTKISTDAGGVDPVWAEAEGPTHPRGYGTYPRVLSKYVREEGVLTLEDAVRKMSGAVAARLRIPDRGRVSPGCFADLVIFDSAAVGDRATFERPHQLSEG